MNQSENNSVESKTEIDITTIILILWKNKYIIILCTIVASILGAVYALKAPSTYTSYATLSSKDSEQGSNASGILSQIGGNVGGMLAGQLGMRNANLDKLDILLRNYEMAEYVINKNKLMPKLFPEIDWNKSDTSTLPKIYAGIKKLKMMQSVSVDIKKKILIISIAASTPELSKQIVDMYISALSNKLKKDILEQGKNNRKFLDQQLNNTIDPIIKDKISNMVALEIEKQMLAGSQSFEVLENAILPVERTKPIRSQILILSVFSGFFLSIIGVLGIRIFKLLTKHFKSHHI